MTKYQVGDKVDIRKNLKVDKPYQMEDGYDYDIVVEEMMRFAGATGTIKTASDWGYSLLEDDEKCRWTDEMFVGISKPKVVEKHHVDATVSFNIHVEEILHNEPATILFYRVVSLDKTGNVVAHGERKKIVAKCDTRYDEYNREKGFTACVLKAYRKEIQKELRKL